MLDFVFNRVRNILDKPMTGDSGFRFKEGDDVIAEFSTEGDYPVLSTAVTVAKLLKDRSGALVVDKEDTEATEATVAAHNIYSPKSRGENIGFIPRTYLENNLRIKNGAEPLRPEVINAEIKEKIYPMNAHPLMAKEYPDDIPVPGSCGM